MRKPFQFRLGALLYVVTVICVLLAAERVTAGTAYDDEVGGAIIWGAIFLGAYLHSRGSRSAYKRLLAAYRDKRPAAPGSDGFPPPPPIDSRGGDG
jgi:hypothetical protein